MKRYKLVNNKIYELSLAILRDDDEFYYDSDLWTNDELLNENDYSDEQVNHKYKSFINKKSKNFLIEMNNNIIELNSPDDIEYSLKEVFEQNIQLEYKDFKYNGNSPWGFNRSGNENVPYEIYNKYFGINQSHNAIKYRLGIAMDQSPNESNVNELGSCEGIGLYLLKATAFDGETKRTGTYQKSSGFVNWFLDDQFSKCLVWIEIGIATHIIKIDGLLYGENNNGELVLLDDIVSLENILNYNIDLETIKDKMADKNYKIIRIC